MSERLEDIEVPCQYASCAGNGTAIWSGGARFHGKDAPKQCYACYQRNLQVTDVTINCPNCEEEYTYKARSIIWHLREVGDWENPSLCRFCTDNPQYKMRTLNCQNAACREEFKFGPKWQKKIDDRGHDEPALCEKCREANKAQQPVSIVCEACSAKFTYSRSYVISWKRSEGWWEDRKQVCRLCFDDPERAKRLQEKKEEKEKEKKEKKENLREEKTVGYYLLKMDKANWEGIVDRETYHVPSNVQSYDVLSEVSAYESIVERAKDGSPITSAEHIMVGLERKSHGWEDTDFSDILSNACYIADDTGSNIIECEDAHSHYIVKYDDDEGVVAIICYNKLEGAPYRIKTSFVKSQKDVANAIQNNLWKLS